MIAFVQPFGLNDPGGGSRILRALVAEAPMPYVSICTRPDPPAQLHRHEVHLSVRPHLGRIESTRLAQYIQAWRLERLLAHRFRRALRTLLQEKGVQVVHAIPHGLDFWNAFEVARSIGAGYVLNVHDDLEYNIGHRAYYEDAAWRLAAAWRSADHRFVISQAMATAYADRFAERPSDVVTDGLTESQIAPEPRSGTATKALYFMGAMHLTYHPNVAVVMNALAESPRVDERHFIFRGSACPVESERVDVEERPFANEETLRHDFDDAGVLYFPLPFGPENASFVKYSLSTKLVTYLGSGVPILYHGPREAAAAQLLAKHEAAVIVDSLQPAAVRQGLAEVRTRGRAIAQNALALGRAAFRLEDQLAVFWGAVERVRSDADTSFPAP